MLLLLLFFTYKHTKSYSCERHRKALSFLPSHNKLHLKSEMRIQPRHLPTNKFALQPNMQIFVKTVSITCRPYSRYCLVFSHRLTPSACVYALRSRLQRSRRRAGVFECAKIAPCRSLNFFQGAQTLRGLKSLRKRRSRRLMRACEGG